MVNIGDKFNRLTVLEKMPQYKGKTYTAYRCKCDCGNETIVGHSSLITGKIKSCGCYRKEFQSLPKEHLKKKNKIEFCGDFAKVHIGKNGDCVVVDIDDIEKIKDYWWVFNRTGYAVCKSNKNKLIFMHRLISNNDDNLLVTHHIDHDIKNNRKSNLQIVTKSYNNFYRKTKENNTGYRNIYKHIIRNKYIYYRVSINYEKKLFSLGEFKTIENAINARNNFYEKNNIKIKENEK